MLMFVRKIRKKFDLSGQNFQHLRHYKLHVKFIHMTITYVYTDN